MINTAMTPREFADTYLVYDDNIETIQDLYDYMENHKDDDHWYYLAEDFDAWSDRDEDDSVLVLVEDPVTREAAWFEEDATGWV